MFIPSNKKTPWAYFYKSRSYSLPLQLEDFWSKMQVLNVNTGSGCDLLD